MSGYQTPTGTGFMNNTPARPMGMQARGENYGVATPRRLFSATPPAVTPSPTPSPTSSPTSSPNGSPGFSGTSRTLNFGSNRPRQRNKTRNRSRQRNRRRNRTRTRNRRRTKSRY
jgi:hypothetical protein